MSNQLKYNKAAADKVITALEEAIKAIGTTSIPELEKAAGSADNLELAKVGSIADALSAAQTTETRLEAFKRKVKSYGEAVQQFDLDAASLLNSILDGAYDGYAFDENGNLIYGADGDPEISMPWHSEGGDPDLNDAKDAINSLADAANSGYDAAGNSTDPNVASALADAEDQIEAQINSGKILTDADKDKIFAEACAVGCIQIADDYGKKAALKFAETDTKIAYASMLASNPGTDQTVRKNADNYLESQTGKKADFNLNMVCTRYVSNIYKHTQLGQWIGQLTKPDAVEQRTTAFYSALAGGDSREYGNVTNGDRPNEYVKAVISLGNKKEPIKIKLSGDDEYITIYDSSKHSFTTNEQVDIMKKAGVMKPLDVVFFGKDSYDANGKTIKSTSPSYNPDVNQSHVAAMDSGTTYSGMGQDTTAGKSNVQKGKELDPENKYGVDVVLMNHDDGAVQSVIGQFGR